MSSNDTKSFESGAERRESTRHDVKLDVNYRHGDNYLFSRTSDASDMGIFLVAEDPLPAGAVLELEFKEPNTREPIRVLGRIAWVENGARGKEPGMGIQFIDLTPEVQARIKSLIRIFALLD